MNDPDEPTVASETRRSQSRRDRAVVLFADRAGSIIRAGDELVDEESLPVLTAFRQFLEAERRRSRRQMAALIAVFLAVLAGVVGGGGWYLRSALGRVQNVVEADQVRNEESRLAALSNLHGVAQAAVALKQDMLDTRKTSRVLEDRVAAQNNELARLLDTLTTLEIQNSLMQRNLRRLNEAPATNPALEPRTEPDLPQPGPEARVSLPEPPPGEEPRVRAEPPPPAPAAEFMAPEPGTPVAAEPALPPGTGAIAVGVTPGGVPYRLPLPRN